MTINGSFEFKEEALPGSREICHLKAEQQSQNDALTRSQTPERRELDYVRNLGAINETAKEIKIFGLSDFIINGFGEV